jgi:hypothetical protein
MDVVVVGGSSAERSRAAVHALTGPWPPRPRRYAGGFGHYTGASAEKETTAWSGVRLPWARYERALRDSVHEKTASPEEVQDEVVL